MTFFNISKDSAETIQKDEDFALDKALDKVLDTALDIGQEHTPRVLLIEDDRSTRRMVSSSLRDHCQLLEAASSGEGISLYNTFQPDIVFMDIELPDGSGQNLLNWILRNDPGAFVVMFSGHHDKENILASAENGAKGFIAKPFDVSKMLYFINICPRLH